MKSLAESSRKIVGPAPPTTQLSTEGNQISLFPDQLHDYMETAPGDRLEKHGPTVSPPGTPGGKDLCGRCLGPRAEPGGRVCTTLSTEGNAQTSRPRPPGGAAGRVCLRDWVGPTIFR